MAQSEVKTTKPVHVEERRRGGWSMSSSVVQFHWKRLLFFLVNFFLTQPTPRNEICDGWRPGRFLLTFHILALLPSLFRRKHFHLWMSISSPEWEKISSIHYAYNPSFKTYVIVPTRGRERLLYFNKRNKKKLSARRRGALPRVAALGCSPPELVLDPHSWAVVDSFGVKMNGHILCVLASFLSSFFLHRIIYPLN